MLSQKLIMQFVRLLLTSGVASLLNMSPSLGYAAVDATKQFQQSLEPLLIAKRFDQLDAMSDDFRKSDERVPGGDQKLALFYYGLGALSEEQCECTSLSYQDKAKIVKEWLKHNPHSISAHIVMARLLVNYAWVGRGQAYASDTTSEQFDLFRSRMDEAAGYVKDLDPTREPQVYGIYTSIARSGSSARRRLDAIYADATKNSPRWFYWYSNRADILQRKWYGKPGELARYTQSLLTSPGGDDGMIAYCYAAERLVSQYDPDELFTVTGLDWPTVKQAYVVRERRYGLDNRNWNLLMLFAEKADDPATAAMALEHVGTDWDKTVWNEFESFDGAARWAKHPLKVDPSMLL